MKPNKNVLSRVMHGSEIYAQPFAAAPLVELAGECRVLIEHHRGVIIYEPFEIKIRVSYGCIQVIGNQLRLVQMTKEKLVITGTINEIRLERTFR